MPLHRLASPVDLGPVAPRRAGPAAQVAPLHGPDIPEGEQGHGGENKGQSKVVQYQPEYHERQSAQHEHPRRKPQTRKSPRWRCPGGAQTRRPRAAVLPRHDLVNFPLHTVPRHLTTPGNCLALFTFCAIHPSPVQGEGGVPASGGSGGRRTAKASLSPRSSRSAAERAQKGALVYSAELELIFAPQRPPVVTAGTGAGG